jgi:hypothetical protein
MGQTVGKLQASQTNDEALLYLTDFSHANGGRNTNRPVDIVGEHVSIAGWGLSQENDTR